MSVSSVVFLYVPSKKSISWSLHSIHFAPLRRPMYLPMIIGEWEQIVETMLRFAWKKRGNKMYDNDES